jgi:hypothetical protein
MREKSGGQAVRNYRWHAATSVLFLLTACPPASSLAAQHQPQPAPAAPSAPAVYRYGKWTAALLAAGATAMGISTHNAADRAYDDLIDWCRDNPCRLRPDGYYMDAEAEARYDVVVRRDRAARVWFVAGQAALAGAVALFILEIRHGPRDPANVPFSGLVLEPGRVGWKLTW